MIARILARSLLAGLLLIGLLAPLATAQDQPSVEVPKEPDGAPGPGHEPLAVGGPDAFGYTYRDSAQADGPAYSWVEIAGTGTAVLLGDDDYDGPFPIDFSFNFYGSDYTEFYIQSNGVLNFDDVYVSLSNQCPQPVAGEDNLIALMWDDLDPGDTGDPVYYQSFAAGMCPYPGYAGACLVVEYWNYHHYQGGGGGALAGTWEAILFDNHYILLQYQDAGAEEGSGSTTGIENADGSDGLTYACDTAGSLRDGRAVMFYYPGPNLAASRKTATAAVELGERIDYAVEIANTGNQPAASAALADVLPEGTTFIPGSLACSSGTCQYDAGDGAIYWDGEVTRAAMAGARPTPGRLLAPTGVRDEVQAPVPETSAVPHQIIPAAAPPGTVLETFPNVWDIGAEGLVYDPGRDRVRYAHEVFGTADIWDVAYPPPHGALGSILLSAVNPGWPAGLDRRNGVAYDPTSDTYLLPDYNGDASNADDNIVEVAPDGTILNAWETDGTDNDSYDGSSIDGINDIAVVPGTPPRYFVAALEGNNNVYEIDLIKTGSWWTPATWGKVMTCTLTGLVDNLSIDYDAEHGLLYHSDWSSTAIVVTDLDCHVLDAFTCDSPAGQNHGVTYIEGKAEPEIWVTNDVTNETTRCAASSVPPCDRTDTVFADDFEGGLGDWSLTGLWNEEHEADPCGSLVAPFPSSDTGAYFGLDGTCTYDTGARVSGTLELDLDFDLSRYNHASLNFWSYEQTECGGYCSYDRRYVDVSTDGGATWATVWASTGPEGAWYQASANLWDYAGGMLRVRFRFDSGDAIGNGFFGWLVDNVELVACPLPVQLSFAVEAPQWCGPVVNEAVITDPEAGTVTLQATTHVVEDLYQLWDFELDDGGFARELPGEWEWGAPTYPPGLTAHGDRFVWGTDLHGDADDTVGHHRLSRSVSLPTHPNGIYLSWWDWYGAESSDCTNVTVDGTPVYGQCDVDQRQWAHHVVDLSAWAGQTVDLEFDLEVCCVPPGPDGWYIDDVAIQSGCISDVEVDAPPLEVSLCSNEVRTLQFAICNHDNLPLEWYLWEMDAMAAGWAMAPPTAGEPLFAAVPDQEQPVGEELTANLAGAKASQPSFSHCEGSNPSQLEILVCSDSCQVSPPDTCPEVALQNLGESYDLYFQDWIGCQTAVESGAYDLVLVDNACFFPAGPLFTALDNFLLGGGQVFVNTFEMDSFPWHPFWDHAGVTFASDVVIDPPPPVYGWLPDHPVIADWPSDPLQFDNLYIDDGDKFDARPSSMALAGYTAAPTVHEGALALRYDNRALVSGFCIDNLANRDDDSDGVSDCVEVWQAGIGQLLNPSPDIPWLSESAIAGRVLPDECTDVEVIFDPAGLPIDDYTAQLLIQSNDPDTPAIHLPVTMHVICAAHIYLPLVLKDHP
jgi:uncharacterized repeat protein (TIGR01451 family)